MISTSRRSSDSVIASGGISTTTSPSGRMIAPRRRAASVTSMAGAVARRSLGELDPDHEPPLADLGHAGERDDLALEQPREELDLRRELLDRALVLERLKRRDPGRAGERVTGVGVAVEEAPVVLVAAEETLVQSLGGERRGEREVAAGDPFADAHQVRDDVLVLAGEHPAGPPEAGGDLVADEQHAVLVAQFADSAQVAVRLHEHAGGALHERLDDHRGDRLAVFGEQALEVLGVARAGGDGVEQQRPVDGVEQVDAADRHRPERVAVVRVLQADELRALRLAPLGPPLERHLQRRSRRRSSRCRNRTRG